MNKYLFGVTQEALQSAITSALTGYATTAYVGANFQSALISGTNIKTINGNSILGSGDLVISGGGSISDGDKGDITVSSSGTVWTIDNGTVTLAKQANMATASVVYRKTAGSGAPEVQTLATLKTDLGLTGTNSGDQDLSGYGLKSGKLSQFAATTSSELAGVISDETGSGFLVFATSPTLSQPIIDNLKLGYTTTATAAGTTTLTTSSNCQQFFTGTTTQTVVLPVASTMTLGQFFVVENNSTGNLTVNSSGGNLVATVIPGTSVKVACILASGTTASSWDVEYAGFATVTGTGSCVLSASPTITGQLVLSTASLVGTILLSNALGGSVRGAGDIYIQSDNGSTNQIILGNNQGGLALTGVARTIRSTSGDLTLLPSSGLIEQRNGTTAQEFRVANTWTSTTNFEEWACDWKTTTNRCIVGPKVGASGTLRQQVFTGISSTTADPTTTEFASGQYGIHKNTTSGAVFWVYNDAGTIKKVQLT